MKIKFLEDAFYNKKLFAKKGEVKEMEDSFAQRWLNRGHAFYKEEEKKEEQGAKEAQDVNALLLEFLQGAKKKELLEFVKDNEILLPEDLKKAEEIRDFLIHELIERVE